MFRIILALFLSLTCSVGFSQYIPQGYHAHRTIDGRIIIHSDKHYGDPRAHVGIAYPWVKIAKAGDPIPGYKPKTTVRYSYPSVSIMPYTISQPVKVYSTPTINYNNYYMNPTLRQRAIPYKSGCPGGRCPG